MKFGQRVYHDKHGKGIVIRIQKPDFWVKYDKYEKPIRHEPKQVGKRVKLDVTRPKPKQVGGRVKLDVTRPESKQVGGRVKLDATRPKPRQVGGRVKLDATRSDPKQVRKRVKLKPISIKTITYTPKCGADWRKDDDVIYLGKL